MDGNCVIVGMDTGFHDAPVLSRPVCAAVKAPATAASLGHETILDYTALVQDSKI
jgi:hypothetical protein